MCSVWIQNWYSSTNSPAPRYRSTGSPSSAIGRKKGAPITA